ncbi:hypothetical protein L9F63_007278, partial [Diploptera punctata]
SQVRVLNYVVFFFVIFTDAHTFCAKASNSFVFIYVFCVCIKAIKRKYKIKYQTILQAKCYPNIQPWKRTKASSLFYTSVAEIFLSLYFPYQESSMSEVVKNSI